MDLVQQRFAEWSLSPAERDVALFAIKGMSVAEIAAPRGTSEGTVKADSGGSPSQGRRRASRPQLLSLFIEDLFDPRPQPPPTASPQPGQPLQPRPTSPLTARRTVSLWDDPALAATRNPPVLPVHPRFPSAASAPSRPPCPCRRAFGLRAGRLSGTSTPAPSAATFWSCGWARAAPPATQVPAVPNTNDPLTFTWTDGKGRERSIRPQMMYTDGGSIPQIGQVSTASAPGAPAYMVHDWLYVARHCNLDQTPDWSEATVADIAFDDSAVILAASIKAC